MDTLAEARGIRALHAEDLGPVQEVLVRYLAEWMGGPAAYSAERGHPRLRRRHQHVPIGPVERDAWLTCMRRALRDVVAEASLRRELDAKFTRLADFLRNDAAHAHAPHGEVVQIQLPTSPAGAAPPACLTLGQPVIDADHHAFVRLVEEMKGCDDASFGSLFGQLLEHTEEHFARESELMASSQFPATAEHEAEHQRVLGELGRFRARVAGGSLTLARAFVRESLGAWFDLHIRTMDSALVAHLGRHG